MSQTTESNNKAFVLAAFDTLFNKRDYAGAERYWSPDYIQASGLQARGQPSRLIGMDTLTRLQRW
ncbi:MAG TPA: hypothetical protein VN920_10525 [Pyrinomonadaceae bacterium]|nr:hypothetical protein [Pyrinomonadaceae bacterium]